MRSSVAEFMRFSAPDPGALAIGIDEARIRLASARAAGDSLAVVDAAADLASMLTTARMETEAVRMLELNKGHAEVSTEQEPTGWFWNAYATALQYCGRRNEAEPYFVRAIEFARAGRWQRLEALALHHWGRCLAEQQRYAEAEARISEALAIRVQLKEPRQESSRRALVELSKLRNEQGHPHARSDA